MPSDTAASSTGTASTSNPAICNQYIYRRDDTNSISSTPGGLRKAYIFSIQTVSTTIGDVVDRVGATVVRSPPKQFSSIFYKMFQINPPSVQAFLQNVKVDVPGTNADGGNDTKAAAPGMATTSFEMIFDRSQEVAASSRPGKRAFHYYGVMWKDIGVAKDIMDVFSVLLGAASYADFAAGNHASASGGYPTPGGGRNVDDAAAGVASVTNYSTQLFDLAGAGAQIVFSPIALVFNSSLVIYGRVTSFAWTFAKFNANLVPVTGSVQISMEIFNVSDNTVPTNGLSPTSGSGTVVSFGSGGQTNSKADTSAPIPKFDRGKRVNNT